MENLIENILALEKISQELEPALEERNELNNQIQDYANQFIASINDTPSYYAGDPDSEKLSIKSDKKELEELLSIYTSEVVEKGINPASGGHIGYIPGVEFIHLH